MEHVQHSADEVRRRGKDLYEQMIRAQVETEENIGRVVVIDIHTGDYLIDDDSDNPVQAALALQRKHPGAVLWGERIGYTTVFALGGADLLWDQILHSS